MTCKPSFAVYKDTVRRILPISVILFAIVSLISAITVFFTSWAYEQMLVGGSGFFGYEITLFDFYEMSPLIISFAAFGVPVLVLVSNSYMTRRADSDFYDSLPHTRATVAYSTMLGVFSVSALICLLAFGVAILCGYLFADSFVIPWGNSIMQLLAVLVTAWFSVSIFSISTAITGTTFSALSVGFLIAIGPRELMFVINSAISAASPVLVSDSLLPLFDNNYNMLTALLASNTTVAASLSAYIYSVILAAIYTALAVWAYKRRKSESATQAAPSRILQHFYRISVATLLCSLAFIIIFGYGFDSVAVLVLVLSVILYFLYELITTKRAKNLLGALLTFPIFVLVNLAIAGTILLGSHIEANFAPDADSVDSISEVLLGEDSYISFEEYVSLLSGEVEITDKDTVSLVTKALSENVQKHLDGTYDATYYSNHSEYVSAIYRIKAGLRTEYRRIYIKPADLLQIRNKLAESDDYKNLWYSLPENPEIVGAEYGSLSFDEQNARAIYDAARSEILSLGYERWSEIYYSYDYDSLTVSFNVSLDGKSTTVYLKAPSELSETYRVADEKLALLMSEKKENTLDMLQEFLADENDELYLWVDLSYDSDYFGVYCYRSGFNDTADATEFVEFISTLITTDMANYSDSTYIDVGVMDYSGNGKDSGIISKIPLSVTKEEIKNMFERFAYLYE